MVKQNAAATMMLPPGRVSFPRMRTIRHLLACHLNYFFGGNGIGPSKYPGGSLGRMNWVWPLMLGLCWVSVQAESPTKVSDGMRGYRRRPTRHRSCASRSPVVAWRGGGGRPVGGAGRAHDR